MLLVVAVFWFARREQWALAALMAGLAGITPLGRAAAGRRHPAGVSPARREATGAAWARLRAALRPSVLSLAIVPVPFLLYLWWLQARFGEPLVFLEAEQKGWLHTSTFFPQVWLDYFGLLLQSWGTTRRPRIRALGWGGGQRLYLYQDWASASCFAALAAWAAWRRSLRPSELAWLALGVIFPLSLGTTIGVARYILPLWPAFLLLARGLAPRPVLERGWLLASAGLLAATTYFWASGHWIAIEPGARRARLPPALAARVGAGLPPARPGRHAVPRPRAPDRALSFRPPTSCWTTRPGTPRGPPAGTAPANGLLSDSVLQFEPWLAYTAARLHAGALPLWNPDNMLGAPFIGNMQSAVFYPPNWPAFLWPGPETLALRAWLKLFAAALGMYGWPAMWCAWGRLARRWCRGRLHVRRVPHRLAALPADRRGGLVALALVGRRGAAGAAGRAGPWRRWRSCVAPDSAGRAAGDGLPHGRRDGPASRCSCLASRAAPGRAAPDAPGWWAAAYARRGAGRRRSLCPSLNTWRQRRAAKPRRAGGWRISGCPSTSPGPRSAPICSATRPTAPGGPPGPTTTKPTATAGVLPLVLAPWPALAPDARPARGWPGSCWRAWPSCGGRRLPRAGRLRRGDGAAAGFARAANQRLLAVIKFALALLGGARRGCGSGGPAWRRAADPGRARLDGRRCWR